MRFIADFHIHSHYSRATSKEMNIVSLTKWSQLKGTQVVGTGDFTHPAWFAELSQKLEPSEPGLFRLKPIFEKEITLEVPEICRNEMRFLLTVEISSIYSHPKKGVRKVHTIVFAPSFSEAKRINEALSRIGNLRADGRPILGLDPRDLLKIVLDGGAGSFIVPAHAWTPHFSVFGSASGFDSLEECFGDLAKEIFAIETGLSSDPAMNWRLSALDRISLISNSDAHSAEKLGREANVFNTELSYYAIKKALEENNPETFEKTIEFFPEEGKYHLDGHRDCGVKTEPKETRANNFLCSKCGRRVTVGVLHRVEDLADRSEGFRPPRARPFSSIIPLPELLSEILDVGMSTKKVSELYHRLLISIGPEFKILLQKPIEEIAVIHPQTAEAISRMREGKIFIDPGYDGEFGKIKIFGGENMNPEKTIPQASLF